MLYVLAATTAGTATAGWLQLRHQRAAPDPAGRRDAIAVRGR